MTTPKMTFDEFVKELMEYESDTFSASGSELTKDEAINVAEQLILYLRENQVDGVILAEFLEWHRIDTGKINLYD